jgi:DNA (cytosine-5)-methyltransferase 1
VGIKEVALSQYRVVEICAGAGGQPLGLELAGFDHELSVELDRMLLRPFDATGRTGRSLSVMSPTLMSGSQPTTQVLTCSQAAFPARRSLSGGTDGRDLFAWAIELRGPVQPRALLDHLRHEAFLHPTKIS